MLVVEGIDLATGSTIRLRNFSARSFAVESPDAMRDRETREFEFPVGLGKIAFRGIARRRERLESDNGQPLYLVAFEFKAKTRAARVLVEHFVRSLRGEVA